MAGSARVVAATLITALLATACSQGSATRTEEPAAGGKVTLRYFTFSAAADHVKDLDTIVAAFEKENPTVDVQVETAPYDQYFTKLQTSIRGPDRPRHLRARTTRTSSPTPAPAACSTSARRAATPTPPATPPNR